MRKSSNKEHIYPTLLNYDILTVTMYQVSRLLLPIHYSIDTSHTRSMTLNCRKCSYKFLLIL